MSCIKQSSLGVCKGPFWVICSICYIDERSHKADFSDAKLLCAPVPATSPITPAHRDVWPKFGIKKCAWNFYPRGRVEIRREKAIVYANTVCFQYAELKEKLQEEFHLEEYVIELKADNSYHYTNEVFYMREDSK